jgi:D-xylonolactonase
MALSAATGKERIIEDTWRVLGSTRTELGEGPMWSSRRESLFWVDILRNTIHECSPATSGTRHYRLPEMVGWIIECRSEDRFIVGLRTGFAQLRLDPLHIELLGSPSSVTNTRLNDGKADARGRIFAATMAATADEPLGNLYRLDPDGSIRLVDPGYTIPNGPAFSNDGRLLYHTDSACGLIYRFPLNDDGTLGSRSVFLEFPPEWGKPDGMTIDADDHLWVAHWGTSCVSRFTPGGERTTRVLLPTPQITSCAFGGPEFDRLFVTSAAVDRHADPLAGALFEVDVDARGGAPHTFGR